MIDDAKAASLHSAGGADAARDVEQEGAAAAPPPPHGVLSMKGAFLTTMPIPGKCARNRAAFVSLLSLGFLAVSVGGASAACDPGPNQVSFYEHANYAGQCVVKNNGDYPDSGAIGMRNDSISSMRVGQFAQAMICRDNNYGGECLTITSDVPLLGGNRVGNDMISSMRVSPRNSAACSPGYNEAAFFRDGNFSGSCVRKGLGDYPNAQAIGLANDSISSILVGPNAQVVLCVDNDFRGDCIVTGISAPTMSNRVGNDRVSSLKVQVQNTPSCVPLAGQASFYVHADFLAPCVVLGSGRYANAGQMRIGNDQVSSIRVAAGTRVCAFRDNDFGTLIVDVASNLGNLGGNNDQISSVIIVPASTTCASVTPPPPVVAAPPTIRITVPESHKFRVEGSGFTPGHTVYIRVADDQLNYLNYTESSDASGKIDASLSINCLPGVLHFSANDGRIVRGQTLWSNTVDQSCR